MNIHEHQAKEILKKYGAEVPKGFFALNVEELLEKAKSLNTEKYVLKAQIHAGGRGKAGGVKILNSLKELKVAATELLGKTLVTHQSFEGQFIRWGNAFSSNLILNGVTAYDTNDASTPHIDALVNNPPASVNSWLTYRTNGSNYTTVSAPTTVGGYWLFNGQKTGGKSSFSGMYQKLNLIKSFSFHGWNRDPYLRHKKSLK